MDITAFHESYHEAIQPPKKVCVVCQAPADKSCGSCYGVSYCSIEHQKAHWKEHKKACPPIRAVTTPELGTHFVATRDLPPWTLLLTEQPLLVDPIVIFKDSPRHAIFEGRPPSCISCRSTLSATRSCYRCAIPFLCDISCSLNKVHSGFECGVLYKCSVEKKKKLCNPPNLMYLRAIQLKNNDPETWAKVLELPGANQYKPEDMGENAKWFIREILPLLGEQGAGFEEDLAKFMGVTLQRGSMVYANEIFGETQFLYLNGSNFAQNCFPNCIKIIGKGPQFQMQVRNTVEVKMGQILSIDYQVVSSEVGAMTRQHIINDVRGALCICPRCLDPTELDTMQSAVKCEEPDCFDGYLLPEDARDMTMSAPWTCNRLGCKGSSTWKEIEKLDSKLTLQVKSFKKELTDFKGISNFWESLKRNQLHPNHTIIVHFEWEMTRSLIPRLVESEVGNRIFPQRIDLHISMLEHLLKVAEMINPGLSDKRATVLSQLFDGLYFKISWYKEMLQVAEEKKLIERAVDLIDKFLAIAKCYPDNWTATKIQEHIQRRNNLQNMVLNSTN